MDSIIAILCNDCDFTKRCKSIIDRGEFRWATINNVRNEIIKRLDNSGIRLSRSDISIITDSVLSKLNYSLSCSGVAYDF